MANSEGMFGGNGSVHWKIRVKNPKGTPISKPGPLGSHLQEGHDGTPSKSDFTVTVKCWPEHRTLIALSMLSAARDIAAHGRGTFEMPIEEDHHKQIRIKWKSARRRFTPTRA